MSEASILLFAVSASEFEENADTSSGGGRRRDDNSSTFSKELSSRAKQGICCFAGRGRKLIPSSATRRLVITTSVNLPWVRARLYRCR